MWKLLEVGLDGIYCPLLLLNKKKYAALSVSERDGVITKVRTPVCSPCFVRAVAERCLRRSRRRKV
jgi:hypothetical protein